jgi:hypothetical protein
MRAALLAFIASSATAYYQPGDPPQCIDGYQCIFSRFPTDTGLSSQYIWDLRSLCQGAGSEFIAQRDPTCVADGQGVCPSRCFDCKGDKSARIRFNVCGTVSGPVAPVNEMNCPANAAVPGCPGGVGSLQEIPIPASHGMAVQVRSPRHIPIIPEASTHPYTPAAYCAVHCGLPWPRAPPWLWPCT